MANSSSAGESWRAASTAVKIAALLAFVANIYSWISFTTTSWYYSKERYEVLHVGLWRACLDVGCTSLDGTSDRAFAAVQAFAIFGFVSLNIGFLLLMLFIFWGSYKGNSEARIAAAILILVSAATWQTAVIVFGIKFHVDSKTRSDMDIGFSFDLAVISSFLALVSGLLLVCYRGRSTSLVQQMET